MLNSKPTGAVNVRAAMAVGAGAYRESLNGESETQLGGNVGGGLKMRVAGPLRARFDYRVFRLRGEPLYPTVHRFYAGVNLGF